MVCVVAWLPKATVQAAIGGIILDRARDEIEDEHIKDENIDYGNKILTTAIMTILITAPLGAILTENLGKKWLNRDETKLVETIKEKGEVAPELNNPKHEDMKSEEDTSKDLPSPTNKPLYPNKE